MLREELNQFKDPVLCSVCLHRMQISNMLIDSGSDGHGMGCGRQTITSTIQGTDEEEEETDSCDKIMMLLIDLFVYQQHPSIGSLFIGPSSFTFR